MSGRIQIPAITHNPQEVDKGWLREKGTPLDHVGFYLASVSYLLCLHGAQAQGRSVQTKVLCWLLLTPCPSLQGGEALGSRARLDLSPSSRLPWAAYWVALYWAMSSEMVKRWGIWFPLKSHPQYR